MRSKEALISSCLTGFAWQILSLAKENGFVIRAKHICGKLNVLADALSRPQMVNTELCLSQQTFRSLVSVLILDPLNP